MKKRDLRVFFADMAVATGLLRLSEYLQRHRWTVLTYHRVLPPPSLEGYLFPSLAVPESIFRQQIEFLSKRFDLVPVSEGVRRTHSKEESDKPLVSITFDDGYSDNWLHAAPALKEYGISATFFIVSGLIDTEQSLWYDIAARCWNVATPTILNTVTANEGPLGWPSHVKPVFPEWIAHLKRLSGNSRARIIEGLADPGPDKNRALVDKVMTADHLRALMRDGHEIGSHTCTHPLLPQLNDSDLAMELQQSKKDLERMLGTSVKAFCYPNGDHDHRVVAAVRAAGYSSAFTTENSRNRSNVDCMRIGRIDMHPGHSSNSRGEFHLPSLRLALS